MTETLLRCRRLTVTAVAGGRARGPEVELDVGTGVPLRLTRADVWRIVRALVKWYCQTNPGLMPRRATDAER